MIKNLEEHRSVLKRQAIERLSMNFGNQIEILSPQDGHHSNFILSFRFSDLDNRQIVDHLWRREKPITLSYIARSNLIRISFDQFNTTEEIDFLIDSLKNALQVEKEKKTEI